MSGGQHVNILRHSFWFLALIASPILAAELQLPPREAVLKNLRSEHPRLMANAEDFEALVRLCEADEQAGQWRDRLRRSAEQLIETPPLQYRIPDGKRLLSVSRAAKDRVLLLSLMYRLTDDARFANRAWLELDTVTHFKDWNPSHFLDTAEMTFAVSIGYDWLFDVWNAEQRQQLQQAIVEMGLQPALPVYGKQSWWARSIHNWNQVCNGGIGIGALAIADEYPELAGDVLHAALHSLPLAMHESRPDGGWGEGPGYWRYATEYNVYFLAALRTAFNTDFGLAQMPGFSVTGDFPIHFTGPTGLTFNYADAHDSWKGAPQLFWLASAFDEPAYAAAQFPFASERTSALDLLWGATWLNRETHRGLLPLDRYFSGVSVVTMRSQWDDPNAVFVGFKGGDNRVNHGQLDLGSFVLDADGVRWTIDLGPDDYNIPGYFGKQRWSYYRNRTEGHNTLVVNHENQSTSATASIIRFASSQRIAAAVVDLSAAYPEVQHAQRGIALLDRRHVLVRDEIQALEPVAVAWQLHTHADVELAGNRATLKQGDRRMYARILSPADARLSVTEINTDPPQRPLSNVRRITAAVPDPVRRLELVVLLSTDENIEAVKSLGRLKAWPNDLKNETAPSEIP